MSRNSLLWLREHKCQTPNCYHYAEKGYIYCNHCLHGGCRQIDKEDIKRLKKMNKERQESG